MEAPATHQQVSVYRPQSPYLEKAVLEDLQRGDMGRTRFAPNHICHTLPDGSTTYVVETPDSTGETRYTVEVNDSGWYRCSCKAGEFGSPCRHGIRAAIYCDLLPDPRFAQPRLVEDDPTSEWAIIAPQPAEDRLPGWAMREAERRGIFRPETW